MEQTTEKKVLLDCRDVSLGYEGKAIWEGLTFQVRSGDYLCIVGENGSGKSTLIQHLNGLLKPTSGRILLQGRDIWADPKRIRDVRFQVGLVFQYPEYQLFEETVYKDIAFGPRNMGLDEADIDRRVRSAAAFVGLTEAMLDKSPFELSGGQKRRVAIAGVIAMEPRVLVLDEPVTGLDPAAAQDLYRTLDYLNKKEGLAIIMVTHDLRSALPYATAILHAGHGSWFYGDTASYLASPYGKRFGGDGI